MKKIICLFIALTALLLIPGCVFALRDDGAAPDIASVAGLTDERQTDIWVEGESLGDIRIGARGALQVIYIDEAMAKAMRSDVTVPLPVFDMAQFYGSEAARGKKLFIAHVETYKPWDFDYTNVFIGDYHLKKGDILSPSMTNPFGPLASKTEGYFAFAVPASVLKEGKEIQIGYGDYSETWKALK